MKPKVTIVIPTFNRANMVTRAIDTALAQTYPCQIIVCDHGSKDNTPEVVKKYGNKITYIRREKDFGPHFCWLEGVLNAEGEYVHIHMDDDWLEPTYIEETIKLMNPDVGMVFSDAYTRFFDENITKENVLNVANKFGYGEHPSEMLEKVILSERYMLSPAACLYRKKDIIDAIYPGDLPVDFGPKYFGVGPDHFMTLQALLRYKKFACVDKSLLTFAYHKGSITVDAYQEQEKTNKILETYQSVRRYYLLLKQYKEHPETINQNSQIITKRTYKICGIPIIKIKRKNDTKRISFLGIPLIKIKNKNNSTQIKLIGIPIISECRK